MKRKIYFNQNGDSGSNEPLPGPDISAFSMPEGEYVPPVDPPTPTPPPIDPVVTPAPTPTPVATSPSTGKYNPMWDEFATKFSTDQSKFEIPDFVKEGNYEEGKTELDVFLNSTLKHLDPVKKYEDQLPPMVKDYLYNSQQQNFDERKWIESKIQERSVADMPDDAFMKAYYKELNGVTEERKDGWTDEQIDAKVEALKNAGILDVQALQLKQQYKAEQQAQENRRLNDLQAQQAQEFDTFIQDQKKAAEAVVAKNSTISDYFGVKFSEADKKQFDSDFLKMTEIDPKTGRHKLHDYLLSDDNLYKLAAIIWKGDKGMKDYLSSVKESIKADVLNKTGLNPRPAGGGQVDHLPEKPDLSKWAEPEFIP